MPTDLETLLPQLEKEYQQGIEKGKALEGQKADIQRQINAIAQSLLVLSGKIELAKELTNPDE